MRCLGALVALATALLGWLVPLSRADDGPVAPQPPARERHYQPDRTTCTAAAITQAYRQHLLPWADQPPAVLDRLRQLQSDLTLHTLQSCVEQGLMEMDMKKRIEKELNLAVSTEATTPSQAPASSGSGLRP